VEGVAPIHHLVLGEGEPALAFSVVGRIGEIELVQLDHAIDAVGPAAQLGEGSPSGRELRAPSVDHEHHGVRLLDEGAATRLGEPRREHDDVAVELRFMEPPASVLGPLEHRCARRIVDLLGPWLPPAAQEGTQGLRAARPGGTSIHDAQVKLSGVSIELHRSGQAASRAATAARS
jgi:hypothetical protein